VNKNQSSVDSKWSGSAKCFDGLVSGSWPGSIWHFFFFSVASAKLAPRVEASLAQVHSLISRADLVTFYARSFT
jgi:hypothetical protein